MAKDLNTWECDCQFCKHNRRKRCHCQPCEWLRNNFSPAQMREGYHTSIPGPNDGGWAGQKWPG